MEGLREEVARQREETQQWMASFTEFRKSRAEEKQRHEAKDYSLTMQLQAKLKVRPATAHLYFDHVTVQECPPRTKNAKMAMTVEK